MKPMWCISALTSEQAVIASRVATTQSPKIRRLLRFARNDQKGKAVSRDQNHSTGFRTTLTALDIQAKIARSSRSGNPTSENTMAT